ncbi:MAG: GNVR domain-containing protein, partial [Candidatus Paceibacteria bacterium]
KQRFQQAKRELEAAEDRLAQFLERNQSLNSAKLQFQRDRLQRQVSFKEQLYSELQSQLTQTRLDLQRRQPVVTVVEGPAVPVHASAPRRMLITGISVILSAIVGVMLALGRSLVSSVSEHARMRGKLKEIKSALLPR